MSVERKEPARYDRDELNAAIHAEVVGRPVEEVPPGEGGSEAPRFRDAETGEPVPDYVENHAVVAGRLDRWGYYFHGEPAGLWQDASVAVERKVDPGRTFERTAESLGRAYCEVALDVARARSDAGPGEE